MDCLFCRIINNEILSEKIYEDDDFVAILDVNPSNPGHTLLIPKIHSDNFMVTAEPVLTRLIALVPTIARAIGEALDYKAYNFIVNNGPEAGQVINHLHLHIIPRREGDGLKEFQSRKYADGELQTVAEKIRSVLKK